MLFSNSKKAEENIKAYIIENYTPENYGFEETDNFETICKNIMSCFCVEKAYPLQITVNYYKSIQACFEDWCAGLPSILDTCYYYNRSAVDDLGRILEETEEEKARFDEIKAEKCLSDLLYRVILKTCKYQVKNFREEV